MQHAAGQPLLEVARLAARKPDPAQGAQPRMRAMREVMSGESYAVSLTPLAFPGWTLATVIPEKEFLGPVQETTRRDKEDRVVERPGDDGDGVTSE